jgi:hypothetical protein
VVTSDAGLNMDAFLGTFAWDANAGLSFSGDGVTGPDRLVLFSHGEARLAPVASWGTALSGPIPRLGPDRDGSPVVAYARCNRFDCDLFALSVRSGREHKLRSISTSRWSEGAVAVWGGRYLFERSRCARPANDCPGTGLFISSPLRRVAAGSHSRGEFDLRGRVVAFVRSPIAAADDDVVTGYLAAHDRLRGQCVVANAGQLHARGLRHADAMFKPTLTKRFVYWVAGPDTNSEETGPYFVLRRRIPTRSCRQRGPIEKLRSEPFENAINSIAVTGGRVFYTVASSDFLKIALREMTDPLVRDP